MDVAVDPEFVASGDDFAGHAPIPADLLAQAEERGPPAEPVESVEKRRR